MPNVLLFGATGYIGSAVLGTLVRSGNYTVYAVARSATKAPALSLQEAIPVIGSLTDDTAWSALVRAHKIDIVINTATFGEDTPKLLATLAALAAQRQDTYKTAGIVGPKLVYVAVSGLWVHGAGVERTNDLAPVGYSALAATKPVTMVGGLAAYEQSILQARDVLDVAILRPAMAYGRESSIWAALVAPLITSPPHSTATLSIAADPDAVISIAHADDIAAGIERAAHLAPQLGGTGAFPVFDLVGERVALRAVLEAVARTVRFGGTLQLRKPDEAQDGVFLMALSSGVNADSARARAVLGWEPKRRDFLGNVDIFVAGAKAGLARGG